MDQCGLVPPGRVLLPRHDALSSPGANFYLKVNVMATGTVKWFNPTKGYGFIQADEGGKDVFVHISAVERSGLSGLNDGQKVSYDIEAGRDGRTSAVNLTTD